MNTSTYHNDFLDSMSNDILTDQDYAPTSNGEESEWLIHVFDEAKARWLHVEEIAWLLCGKNQPLELATSPPSSPPQSGTLILYDRLATRKYKADGHEWIHKKSNPKKVREDHVKLRYMGYDCIRGNYVHSSVVNSFHRRTYSLIGAETKEPSCMGEGKHECDKAPQDLVLVHYLDTEEAAKMTPNKAPTVNATSGQGQKNTMSMSTSSTSDDQLSCQLIHTTHTSTSVAATAGICTAKSYAEVLEHRSMSATHRGSTDREGDDTKPSASD